MPRNINVIGSFVGSLLYDRVSERRALLLFQGNSNCYWDRCMNVINQSRWIASSLRALTRFLIL